MEINKRLILNRTPKDMPYGSICCAKNMMVDDTGSFLTNDIGFKVAVDLSKEDGHSFFYENIVGVIPCNNEIVIFTQSWTKEDCYIYRKPDNVTINWDNREQYKVDTFWRWNGGKITGTYTYNYKGELIIAVGEYDCPGGLKVPLKCWNLDNNNKSQTYNIEENIPEYDSSYSLNTIGNLICGVYTFFIRFKIDEYNYTRWFQITGDINIIQESQSKRYSHQYLNANDELATPINLPSFEVNSNGISNKNIVITIKFSGGEFDKFQLGYIIKRNSDISCRIQGEYNVSQEKQEISIVNNSFIKEYSVDKILENPNQFFNVKNIINYNNRLYIANYEEHPIEDLSDFASNNTTISVSENVENNAPRLRSTNKIWTITFNLEQFMNNSISPNKTDKGLTIASILTDSDGYVIGDSKQNLIDFLSNYLVILSPYWPDKKWSVGSGDVNFFWCIQKADDNTNNGTICIAKKIISSPESLYWYWNLNIPTYNLKIIGTTVNDLDIIVEYDDNGTIKTWSILRTNNERSCVLGYLDKDYMYFGNGYSHTRLDPNIQPGHNMPDDIRFSIANVYYRTEGTPGGNDDEPGESGGEVAEVGVNTRTLHPYQKYNFFIHYIRKDGSYTLGFPINKEVRSYKIATDISGASVIIPKFKASKPEGDYVGYFISYEDIESTVDCIYITGLETVDNNKKISFTNAKYIFDIDSIRGNKLFINDTEYTIVSGSIEYIENRLTYNHVKAILNDSSALVIDDSSKVAYYIKNIETIYNNKSKILYRLSKNIYKWDEEIEDKDYLPAFYTSQIIVKYTNDSNTELAKELIIDPANSFVTGFVFTNNDSRTTYNIFINSIPMYSNYPIQAMSIKEDFQQAAVTLKYKYNGSYADDPKLRVNTVVSPDKLHDLLELKEAYKAKPSKSYTNFNVDNIYKFDKTIYRSDVISDESLVNGFRNFEINNYKNILENKGKIVNIIGIGLYLIVHTEQSIFVFDRTPKLTSKSQLDIPDTFDVDYQDMMPSNEGFGGLLDKEESILTKNGYVWFDRVNKIIFNFENGKVNVISGDINNFIKNLNIIKIRFAEDIIYNRLLICIYVQTTNQSTITLSYNFNTKSFISIHDYKFTHNFRTSNKSYILGETSYSYTLYEFDNTVKVDYKGLKIDSDAFFPYYTVPSGELYTAKSYIDIIFNKNYFDIKQVDSIRYILSKIIGNVYPYKITEEQLERHYSGNELKIYTDETDSGELDIEVDSSKINKLDDYKHPYYDKGCWNLNYFRNKISTPITVEELTTDAQKLGTNVEKYIEANSYDQTHLTASDSRSLIYGKYIVVRFIFNNNVNVKLEGVDINTNKY